MQKYLFILLFATSLFAVGEAGGIFLLIPPGAMAQGMGEAMVANTNTALMSYYNPASISFSDKNRISATHVKWLPNLASDMYYQFIAFNYRLDDDFAIGGHYIYFDIGQQITLSNGSPQLGDTQFMKAVAFSLAYKLSNASSVGFNIKTYKQKAYYMESKNYAFDFSYFKQGNKINFGILLSNMGSPIKNKLSIFNYSSPAPTNLRLGILAHLYNDDVNTINLLFDANKLLVTRYPMMDWDDDGYVGGYDESGIWLGEKVGEFNNDGKKEYDAKGYMDDPWYLAIFTAWLDDWYLGGDIDYNNDAKIGGWSWDVTMDSDEDGEPDVDELIPDENGIYNNGKYYGDVRIEKGTGDNRSFSKELEEMIYNLGLEYWYHKTFSIRAGKIYDYEGKVFNPTFGFGLRLKQFGFDFGYTAGEQGNSRTNTMFFSFAYQFKS